MPEVLGGKGGIYAGLWTYAPEVSERLVKRFGFNPGVLRTRIASFIETTDLICDLAA